MDAKMQNAELKKYRALSALSGWFRFLGWGILIVGLGVTVYLVINSAQAYQAFKEFESFGGSLESSFVVSRIVEGAIILFTSLFTGILYLGIGELIKAFIDIALSAQLTVHLLSNVTAASPDNTNSLFQSLKTELTQTRQILAEISVHTQQTATMLEHATKPRPASTLSTRTPSP